MLCIFDTDCMGRHPPPVCVVVIAIVMAVSLYPQVLRVYTESTLSLAQFI